MGNIEEAGAESSQAPEDWKVRCDIVSPRNDSKAEPIMLQQYGCLAKNRAKTAVVDPVMRNRENPTGSPPDTEEAAKN